MWKFGELRCGYDALINNGQCEDGGPGSVEFAGDLVPFGTDYDDCGTRYIPATDYCPEGCFESDWSNFYTWHGQGLALGASEDDALYVWPGFMSNVTIKVRQAASEQSLCPPCVSALLCS